MVYGFLMRFMAFGESAVDTCMSLMPYVILLLPWKRKYPPQKKERENPHIALSCRHQTCFLKFVTSIRYVWTFEKICFPGGKGGGIMRAWWSRKPQKGMQWGAPCFWRWTVIPEVENAHTVMSTACAVCKVSRNTVTHCRCSRLNPWLYFVVVAGFADRWCQVWGLSCQSVTAARIRSLPGQDDRSPQRTWGGDGSRWERPQVIWILWKRPRSCGSWTGSRIVGQGHESRSLDEGGGS